MPKIRSSRTVKKRFKMSANGKMIRLCTSQNHRENKTDSGLRRLKREYLVEGKRQRTLSRMMGE